MGNAAPEGIQSGNVGVSVGEQLLPILLGREFTARPKVMAKLV